ncbi:MAG: AlwI family type II restriction endonuclease, partial [Anaerolineaceae bacterium]
FEMEGEAVPRHLGNHKKNSNKDCFSVFIAPTIHPATIAHFYSLYRTSISFYGGISKIIPLNLSDFLRMISVAKKVPQKPTSVHIEKFIKTAAAMALDSENENDWFNSVRNLIETWV